MKKRMLALFLVLVMAVTLMIPAYAQNNGETQQEQVQSSAAEQQESLSVEPAGVQALEENETPMSNEGGETEANIPDEALVVPEEVVQEQPNEENAEKEVPDEVSESASLACDIAEEPVNCIPYCFTGSLTITKTVDQKPTQSFLFTVTGECYCVIPLKVALMPHQFCKQKDGTYKASVTITNLETGTYTVEEDLNWAWKYQPSKTCAKQQVTICGMQEQTLFFDNQFNREKKGILSASVSVINKCCGGKITSAFYPEKAS